MPTRQERNIQNGVLRKGTKVFVFRLHSADSSLTGAPFLFLEEHLTCQHIRNPHNVDSKVHYFAHTIEREKTINVYS